MLRVGKNMCSQEGTTVTGRKLQCKKTLALACSTAEKDTGSKGGQKLGNVVM